MYYDPYGLLSFDPVWGFIHNTTGWEPSDNFAKYIEENRIGGTNNALSNALGVFGSTLAWGAMAKTPKEIGSLGGKANVSPYTNQVSRWTSRLKLEKGGRKFMSGMLGKTISTATTGLLIFEGFYDWTIIIKSAWINTSFTDYGCE